MSRALYTNENMFQPTRKYLGFKGAGRQALCEVMVKMKMAVDKLEEIPNERVVIVVDTPVLVEFVHYIQDGGDLFLRPTTFVHHELAEEQRNAAVTSFYERGVGAIIATPSILEMMKESSLDRAMCMLDCDADQLQRILKPPHKITLLLRGSNH